MLICLYDDYYVNKLVPNVFDKEKYVLKHETLQQYLRLGLKLKKHMVC